MLRKSVFMLTAVLLAAFGTVPPPAYEQPTLTFAAGERATTVAMTTADALAALQPVRDGGTAVAEIVTAVATAAPTLVPPTATATVIIPTATVAEPTTEPTTAAAALDPAAMAAAAAADINSIFVADASAENGAKLVANVYDTEEGVPWACTTCHNLDNPTPLIGPSLLGVGTRAYTRVPGMGPYTYLYESIRNPQDYLVPDFESNPQQMPHFLPTSLTEDMVYDIIAYLMTLE